MSLASNQLSQRAHQWKVTIHETRETPGSVLAFGVSRGSQVVLKIIKQQGDEWLSGEVLRAFDGDGTVRVYEYDAGAVLLERLDPGEALMNLVRQCKDEEATEILAEVMRQMAGHRAPAHTPTLHDWAHAFERYLNTGDKRVPRGSALAKPATGIKNWPPHKGHLCCYTAMSNTTMCFLIPSEVGLRLIQKASWAKWTMKLGPY